MAMFSTGLQEFTTFSNQGSGVDWANTANAKVEQGAVVATSSNGAYMVDSSWDNSSNNLTKLLQGVGFTGTIKTGSFIKGIELYFNRVSTSDSTGPCADYDITLMKANSPIGEDKSTGALWTYTTTYGQVTFGSDSDLWTLGFMTENDVEAADFGAGIRARNVQSNDVPVVDTMKFNIHYNPVGMLLAM